MTDPTRPNNDIGPEPQRKVHSLRDDEIETQYDEHILRLKQSVKFLKDKVRTGRGVDRPMDQDNPIDSPGGYDI